MKCVVLFLLLSGCAIDSKSMYNRDYAQDQTCYNNYGGRWGYCDKEVK
jgi:hypothetical protein